MNRSITKAQRAELEEACTFGVEEAHDYCPNCGAKMDGGNEGE